MIWIRVRFIWIPVLNCQLWHCIVNVRWGREHFLRNSERFQKMGKYSARFPNSYSYPRKHNRFQTSPLYLHRARLLDERTFAAQHPEKAEKARLKREAMVPGAKRKRVGAPRMPTSTTEVTIYAYVRLLPWPEFIEKPTGVRCPPRDARGSSHWGRPTLAQKKVESLMPFLDDNTHLIFKHRQ